MSEDSFFREVEEEMRSERLQEFWKKYGKILIAAAVLLVIGTAGYRYWDYSSSKAAAREGDAFLSAVELDDDGKQEEALSALKSLEGEGSETYKTMSHLREAKILAAEGKIDDAVKQYDAVAEDTKADENFRAIARIKAGTLLVDSGSVTEVEARVGPLAGPGAPYRSSAREVLGQAYYKAGDLEKAYQQFIAIQADANTPSAMQQRVSVMLAVIASDGGPVKNDEQ